MPCWMPQRPHSTSDGTNKRGKWKTEMARVSWPCSVQLIRCLLLWTLSEHQWTIWSEGWFRVAPNYVVKAYDSGLWYMYPNRKVLPSNCEGWLTGETPRPKKGLSQPWLLSRAKPQVFNCQFLGSEEIAGLQNPVVLELTIGQGLSSGFDFCIYWKQVIFGLNLIHWFTSSPICCGFFGQHPNTSRL